MALRGTTGMLEYMDGQGLAGDNAAADRNWLLLASALNRRFNDRRLQTDPRLRRVVTDARWAASSIDANLLVPKGDQSMRRVLDARAEYFADTITPAYMTDAKRYAPKKHPLPKKTPTASRRRGRQRRRRRCLLLLIAFRLVCADR